MCLHKYLNKLVEMTTHNLIGKYPREHFHLLNSKGTLRPSQRNSSIVLDAGRLGVSFFFLLILGPLPFTPLRG